MSGTNDFGDNSESYLFDRNKKAFIRLSHPTQLYRPYIVEDAAGTRVILAEGLSEAAKQCITSMVNVRPVAFQVRGWGSQLFPPAPAKTVIKLNDSCEAIVYEDRIEVGCQTISKEAVDQIYDEMRRQRRLSTAFEVSNQ